MSKKRKPIKYYGDGWYDPNTGISATYLMTTPPKKGDGGCGFCLLNTMLMLAAPAAAVALIVKGWRR